MFAYPVRCEAAVLHPESPHTKESKNMAEPDLRPRSRILYDGRDRAAARAYVKGIGFTDEDLTKPIIGVAHTWIETMTCNINLREQAVLVKEGVRAAGGTPMEFNTIAISDGVTMGTEGMKASLVSREVIADSIELVGRGHMFDGLITLVACDKTLPGAALALIRLDIPSVLIYGGSILPGRYAGRDVTILDVFEAVGAVAAGTMTEAELRALENVACPGAGACGGQYTANTMAMAMEFLGLSPMGLGARACAGCPPSRGGSPRRPGPLGCPAAGPAAEQDPHPPVLPERHCWRCGERRFHQRRVAPGSNGARGQHPAHDRRFRYDQPAHSLDRRPQTGWAFRGRRPRYRRRHGTCWGDAC